MKELTLRELKEFCEVHACEDCPFALYVKNQYGGTEYYLCTTIKRPSNWDVDEIEEAMNEIRR